MDYELPYELRFNTERDQVAPFHRRDVITSLTCSPTSKEQAVSMFTQLMQVYDAFIAADHASQED